MIFHKVHLPFSGSKNVRVFEYNYFPFCRNAYNTPVKLLTLQCKSGGKRIICTFYSSKGRYPVKAKNNKNDSNRFTVCKNQEGSLRSSATPIFACQNDRGIDLTDWDVPIFPEQLFFFIKHYQPEAVLLIETDCPDCIGPCAD